MFYVKLISEYRIEQKGPEVLRGAGRSGQSSPGRGEAAGRESRARVERSLGAINNIEELDLKTLQFQNR